MLPKKSRLISPAPKNLKQNKETAPCWTKHRTGLLETGRGPTSRTCVIHGSTHVFVSAHDRCGRVSCFGKRDSGHVQERRSNKGKGLSWSVLCSQCAICASEPAVTSKIALSEITNQTRAAQDGSWTVRNRCSVTRYTLRARVQHQLDDTSSLLKRHGPRCSRTTTAASTTPCDARQAS